MFSMLDDLRREFDRFFSEAETMMPAPTGNVTGTNWPVFVPPVDITETAGEYIISAEIPGIDPQGIEVRLEGNTLILRGEREQEHDVDEGTMHRSERTFGAFSRSFTLPQDVDGEGIAARFRNGVLTVNVPKSHRAPTKQVPIQADDSSSRPIQAGTTGTPVTQGESEQAIMMGQGGQQGSPTPQATQEATGGMTNTATNPQSQATAGEQQSG